MRIAQDRPHIELFERGTDWRWILSEAKGRESHLDLDALGCVLALSEVYDRIMDESSEENSRSVMMRSRQIE